MGVDRFWLDESCETGAMLARFCRQFSAESTLSCCGFHGRAWALYSVELFPEELSSAGPT